MITWIRVIREMRGIKQRDLSSRSGLSCRTISEIELGRRRPKVYEVVSLARALEVEPFEFIKIPRRQDQKQKKEKS